MTSIALPSEGSATSLRAHTFDDPIRRPPSTGPRTPEGKARSAQNARKHTLAAATPPPDLDTHPEFQARLEHLRKEWRAFTITQDLLVQQLALVSWQLEQVPRIERQLLATPLDATTPADLPAPPPQQADGQPADDPIVDDPTAHIAARHLLQNKPTPLTRLWDHHRRLSARLQSLIRQLQSLQRKPQAPEPNHHHKADRPVLDEELRRIHQRNRQRTLDEQRARTCQNLPQPAPEPAPAQNELPPIGHLNSSDEPNPASAAPPGKEAQ